MQPTFAAIPAPVPMLRSINTPEPPAAPRLSRIPLPVHHTDPVQHTTMRTLPAHPPPFKPRALWPHPVRKLSRSGPAIERMRALERENVLLRERAEHAQRLLLAERAATDEHRRVSAIQVRTILRLQALVDASRCKAVTTTATADTDADGDARTDEPPLPEYTDTETQTALSPPAHTDCGAQTESGPGWADDALTVSEAFHRERADDLQEELGLQRRLAEMAIQHADALEGTYEDMLACKDALIGDLREDMAEMRQRVEATLTAETETLIAARDTDEGWGGDEEDYEEQHAADLRALEAELAEQNALLHGAARNAVIATNRIVALEAAARGRAVLRQETDVLRQEVDTLRRECDMLRCEGDTLRCEINMLRSEASMLRGRVGELEVMVRDAEAHGAVEEAFLIRLRQELDSAGGAGGSQTTPNLQKPVLRPIVPRLVDEVLPEATFDLAEDAPSPVDPPPTAYYTTPSTPAGLSPITPTTSSVFRWPRPRPGVPTSMPSPLNPSSPSSPLPPPPPSRQSSPSSSRLASSPSASRISSPPPSSPTPDSVRLRALESQLDTLLLRCAAADAARVCSEDVEERLSAELRAARADNARLRYAVDGDMRTRGDDVPPVPPSRDDMRGAQTLSVESRASLRPLSLLRWTPSGGPEQACVC
ncbi:hypothetical protein K488DRAFT_72477 [Vararia minispora EC-137]|uniref:Uncharacterized protein n=1 Tax=Vararia minispora EC-137 TaxID=1314806 RepID=A0ACB8QEF6_9AGAM|nr:hypothetical protein K488DRAFT_72477 [Vararia minispora EC-137]